ncbi:glycosyl transferase, group 1 [Alkaliphilus metalliredigens QYMF]|uniref:Glycosyl transferase, group 1 n=1 Tax=Alkaliphilus metalliredigens (strain QYMF) TaxID=293826 RepID=A6TJS2_ALKMQ|nr:glycosyltransferase [Alkaliphilus metalliredigens]ABR46440.1 glycosyl transferase, group 1 [Alkaliphilus metalliredigens QYMF]
MNNIKKIFLVVFPHTPNPRMIKRVKALLINYDVHVIYWDRNLGNKKINELPKESKVTVIKRKANEGSPIKRLGATISVIREIIAIAKRVEPDVLYLSKTDILFAAVLYKKITKTNVRLVYEVSDLHTLMVDQQKKTYKKLISKLIKKTEKSLCKSIELLIVTSEFFYNQFYQDFISKDKVVFMPNTPDPLVFDGFHRKTNEKFTVGFIGAIRYAEQLEMLIDASIEANINVLIAGAGKDYLRIKEYAKNYENVEVYGEYKYNEEIKKLYEHVDCIYSVYDAELKNVQIALPNRLYEAAFTSTPIIASKNTYLGDIVEKYDIGKTILFNSKTELIKVLSLLKEDLNYLKSIEEKSQLFRNDWDLNKHNKNLIKAIGKII